MTGGVVAGQFDCRRAPAGFHRRPACQTFQAIAVKRAPAGVGVAHRVVWNANVAHFGMKQPVQNTTVHNGAAADSGSHREVNGVGDALRRPPSRSPEHHGQACWHFKRTPPREHTRKGRFLTAHATFPTSVASKIQRLSVSASTQSLHLLLSMKSETSLWAMKGPPWLISGHLRCTSPFLRYCR